MQPPARTRLHSILVVEDDELVRLVAVEYLREAGFEVLEAGRATHALAFFEDDAGQLINLVFTDIQMPGGMDGAGLGDYLLYHYPKLPVLLTSGAKRPSLRAQHHRFISKPYDLAEVEKHIRELVS